jgi:hypothetical protein
MFMKLDGTKYILFFMNKSYNKKKKNNSYANIYNKNKINDKPNTYWQ